MDAGEEDRDAIFNSGHGIEEAKVSQKRPRGKCEVQLRTASRASSLTLRSARGNAASWDDASLAGRIDRIRRKASPEKDFERGRSNSGDGTVVGFER